MSEVRFVAVLVDSGHPGIMDRETGKVRVFHLADVAIKATADLNAKHRNSDSYDWSDYKVIAELAEPPERILPEFESVAFWDKDGDSIEVDRDSVAYPNQIVASITVYQNALISATAHVSKKDAPKLASAVLRATGLDPKTTELPEG